MDISGIYFLRKRTNPKRHVSKTNYRKDISRIIFFELINQNILKKIKKPNETFPNLLKKKKKIMKKRKKKSETWKKIM